MTRRSPTLLGYLLAFFLTLVVTCTVSPFPFSVLLVVGPIEKLTLQAFMRLAGLTSLRF